MLGLMQRLQASLQLQMKQTVGEVKLKTDIYYKENHLKIKAYATSVFVDINILHHKQS